MYQTAAQQNQQPGVVARPTGPSEGFSRARAPISFGRSLDDLSALDRSCTTLSNIYRTPLPRVFTAGRKLTCDQSELAHELSRFDRFHPAVLARFSLPLTHYLSLLSDRFASVLSNETLWGSYASAREEPRSFPPQYNTSQFNTQFSYRGFSNPSVTSFSNNDIPDRPSAHARPYLLAALRDRSYRIIRTHYIRYFSSELRANNKGS